MGPGKILSGIKDVTEKVLITSAQFVVDGPVDIRFDFVFFDDNHISNFTILVFYQMVWPKNFSYAYVS